MEDLFFFIEEAICWHRSEDNCKCRKPQTGLLKQIFDVYHNIDTQYSYTDSWMVGDRATDIIAGHNFGLKTALLNTQNEYDIQLLKSLNITPTYYGKDLRDFVKILSG